MASLWQDLRFGLRALRKSPGFTAVAILTLALGIGATTAIWSVVDSVLLHPFPYRAADRLAAPSILSIAPTLPVPVFLEFKEQNQSFEDMIGIAYIDVRYKRAARTEQFLGGWVTPNTFEFLGVKPLLGRSIAQDVRTASSPTVVLSYALWTKLFNRDANVVGKVLTLNDTPRTVVAIMPPRFRYGTCDVWMPLDIHRDTIIRGFGVQPNELRAVGRLKPGVSLQDAAADLEVIAKRFEKAYPAWFQPNFKMVVNFVRDESVGAFKGTLLAMLGAVSLLLLIACSNVANLLLTRASAREKEMLIRTSVGATRGRLLRQLLVEGALLTIVACIAGCLLAFWGLKAVAAAIPPDTVPQEVVIALRPTALVFALCVSIVTGVACGLAPALHVADRNSNLGIAWSGKGAGIRHGKLRASQVIAEVALSIVLLVGAGLLLRSVFALESVDIGFDPAKVAYAYLSIPEGRYDTAQQKAVYFRKLLNRLAVLPGVVAATEATSVPPYSWGGTEVVIPGKAPSGTRGATFDMCSEGYFETLGRRLLQGRLLSRTDVDSARRVVVVNQTFARAYFGSESPVGHSIRLKTFEEYATDWPSNAFFEIIGVLEDAKNHGLQDAPKPEMYFPHTITGIAGRAILVRTAGRSASILPALQQAITDVDPDVIVTDAGSLQDFLNRGYYSGPRFTFVVLGTFAGIALLLVLVGVFGLMAYAVSLQSHDIGIRMALGAQESDVLGMVLKKGMTLMVAGTMTGLLASLALRRLIASQIYLVSPTDPWTLTAVAGLVLIVGLAACWLPARRAARVDPLVALRYE
jgi:putative ABC transport system permease protein